MEFESDRGQVSEARRLLGECGLFSGLGPDERIALFARVRIRIRNFSAGDTIFLKGSPGDQMMAVLDGKERTADATAATECSLATLDRGEILSFLDRYPSAWRYIAAVLCGRLRESEKHLAELSPQQVGRAPRQDKAAHE